MKTKITKNVNKVKENKEVDIDKLPVKLFKIELKPKISTFYLLANKNSKISDIKYYISDFSNDEVLDSLYNNTNVHMNLSTSEVLNEISEKNKKIFVSYEICDSYSDIEGEISKEKLIKRLKKDNSLGVIRSEIKELEDRLSELKLRERLIFQSARNRN